MGTNGTESVNKLQEMLHELWASGALVDPKGTTVRLRSSFGICEMDLETFDKYREFLEIKKYGKPRE